MSKPTWQVPAPERPRKKPGRKTKRVPDPQIDPALKKQGETIVGEFADSDIIVK